MQTVLRAIQDAPALLRKHTSTRNIEASKSRSFQSKESNSTKFTKYARADAANRTGISLDERIRPPPPLFSTPSLLFSSSP